MVLLLYAAFCIFTYLKNREIDEKDIRFLAVKSIGC